MAKKKQVAPEDARMRQIAEKLRQLRIDKGYTSYESFAFDNNLPTIQYWRLETGANFTIKSLLRILNIHKLTMEEFFQGIH